MWMHDVTWGQLRAMHEELEAEGSTSPDDLLSYSIFQERGEGQPDDAAVFQGDVEEGIDYSFTFDEDDDRVLELIKSDSVEGIIFVRENGDWKALEPNDQSPTVFDVPTRNVHPASIGWAVNFWDSNSTKDAEVTLNDVERHLA